MAQSVVEDNLTLKDRVKIVNKHSTEITIGHPSFPEPADVVIGELLDTVNHSLLC